MGDMTTPDFDDLLAAFDIPDLDPKDTMDSGQEDPALKQAAAMAGSKTPAGQLTEAPAEEPVVSVIVKNSLSPKKGDPITIPAHNQDACHFDASPMHNGFEVASVPRSPKPASPTSDCGGWSGGQGKIGAAHLGDEASGLPTLSPAGKLDSENVAETEVQSEGVKDDCFSPCPTLFPIPRDSEAPKPSEGAFEKSAAEYLGFAAEGRKQSGQARSSEEEKSSDVESEELEPESSPLREDGGASTEPTSSPVPVSPDLWPAPTADSNSTVPASPEKSAQPATAEVFPSPPILGRPIKREPESPCSVTSNDGDDSSSKEESSSTSSSRPLKVRIKTIKTSSGGIMRTVTRVPSDSEPRCDSGAPNQEDEQMEEGRKGLQAASLEETSTPPLPPKQDGPEIISLQLGNGAMVKGTVLPTSTFHNASTAMLMAASIAQKATQAPGSAKGVSKNVHLASLNLVPQTPSKSPAPAVATKPGSSSPAQPKSAQAANGASTHSQTPLVKAFHKLLNGKNPLPTYRPNLNPPADSCLALPPSGYRCLECGDAFALERSLARHYDRRSMRIDVTCNHCAKRVVFFNRCSLMLHAREHKDKGLVMQCSNLVMKPIALDQMVGQPDVATSRSGSGEQPAMPLYTDPAIIECDNHTCSECSRQFPDRVALASHFQLASSASATQVCQLCQMSLPNKCSYFAHYRLHKNKSPYICPECGGVCRAAHIQGHVKDVCFHFTRKVGYKCPQCGVVYGLITSIKSHIQDMHCEAFHKCPICPMAFKSAPSAHSHIYTQHPGVSNQQAKVIHKCAMCDTVFTHLPLLSTHFDQHLTKQQVSVYKCPQCPVLFAQKRTMMEHVKGTHSHLKSEEPFQREVDVPVKSAPKSSPESTDSFTDDSSSSPKAVLSLQHRKEMRLKLKNAGWTCGQCQMWFPEREEYVTHMKKDHGKAMKKFPCRLCERSFCSAPSLRRHVRVNHEGIKRVYSCRHCIEGKRTFSSRLTLEKHLQLIHGINLADHQQDQENLFERVSIKTTIRKRPPSRDRAERWGLDVAKIRKVNGSSPYRCVKCGYTTNSFADFHKHIPQHRVGGSSYQCRQCGLCFTAHPSLTRHLFIMHGVKEARASRLADKVRGTNLEGRVICDVCGKLFDTEPLLKTHFRTHGMAFIKSKQNTPEN
ncbi:zinc finger protein 687-like [Narcine bancroftii]|uniref:zinc finger protein 687-like n=1 Tax=Narcine bancroftii TaxID=1343680 RepID=UPI00383188BE